MTLLISINIVAKSKIIELYENQNWKEIVEVYNSSDEYTGKELFYIGTAYFQTGDDVRAIEMFESSISEGYTEDFVYRFLGISARFIEDKEKSISALKESTILNPNSQFNFSELGKSYEHFGLIDSAYTIYFQARELDYQTDHPYDRLPKLFLAKNQMSLVAHELSVNLKYLPKDNPLYLQMLNQLIFILIEDLNDYKNAVSALELLKKNYPKQYYYYPRLIEAYYQIYNYAKGDELRKEYQELYKNGKIKKNKIQDGMVRIQKMFWQNRVIYAKYVLAKPKEIADPMYKFFIYDESGKNLESVITTEKAKSGKVKHNLVEWTNEKRVIYPYQFETNDIPYRMIQEIVLEILDIKAEKEANND